MQRVVGPNRYIHFFDSEFPTWFEGSACREGIAPGLPLLRLVSTPNELSTTVPASLGEVRGAHNRFEVLTMDDDDKESVVSAVSFEEDFEKDLGE